MAVPTVESLMIPLLQIASDHQEHSLGDAVDELANLLQLTEEERQEMPPSGRQTKLEKRVGWARMHLGKAGLLKSTARGKFVITERGLRLLRNNPSRLTLSLLQELQREMKETSN